MCTTLPAARALFLFSLCVGPGGAGNDTETRAVIDRAMKAHGGAAKLSKLRCVRYTLKGKCFDLVPSGADYTDVWAVQVPDKLREELDISVLGRRLKVVRVIDGDEGWVRMAETTRKMDREALAERKECLYADQVTWLAPLTGKGFRLTALGETIINGRAAVGVRVSHPKHRDIGLYFDRQTGLVLKRQRRAKDPTDVSKEFTEEMFFDGSREVGGIRLAQTITILRNGKKYAVAVWCDLTTHAKLDDSTFARPDAVPSK